MVSIIWDHNTSLRCWLLISYLFHFHFLFLFMFSYLSNRIFHHFFAKCKGQRTTFINPALRCATHSPHLRDVVEATWMRAYLAFTMTYSVQSMDKSVHYACQTGVVPIHRSRREGKRRWSGWKQPNHESIQDATRASAFSDYAIAPIRILFHLTYHHFVLWILQKTSKRSILAESQRIVWQ